MTTANNSVFEIGLMMRVTWNLHSLNNEGTVGNVSEPRTVVLADGTKTDGVSGEMLKHLHSYNVWLAERQKDRFCPACQRLEPQKADHRESKAKILEGLRGVREQRDRNIKAISLAISDCILCDLHGFLLEQRREGGRRQATAEGDEEEGPSPPEGRIPAVSRRSTVEFGWAIGVPESWYRDIHTHARHSMEERGGREHEEGQEEARREVAAQMVYHRPTRSGVYALVSLFQPWRIGLNDITYEYAVDDAVRLARYGLALEGYKNLLQRGDGAMTSTRLPHVEGVEGVIAVSRRNAPAPIISPLREDYGQQLEALAASNGSLTLHRFSTVAEACQVLDELAQAALHPFRS